MLQLTDQAVEMVKHLISIEKKDGYGLRFAVQGCGCSGFRYGLSYEKEQTENDHVLEFNGLRVFVDAMSNLHLDGIRVDYVDSLSSSGFKIDIPKATGTCGCGASFSM